MAVVQLRHATRGRAYYDRKVAAGSDPIAGTSDKSLPGPATCDPTPQGRSVLRAAPAASVGCCMQPDTDHPFGTAQTACRSTATCRQADLARHFLADVTVRDMSRR